MGYELRRQLRNALGPDIIGLQRAVALEITDDANDKTRESYVGLDELARWTGAKDSIVVRDALKRLAVKGWEFRIPIGKGRDGRLLYAVPGRRMTFRVPPFEGDATATPSEDKEKPGLPLGEAGATPSNPQGEAGASSEDAGAPSEDAGATPFSSPLTPQEEEEASSPAAAEHLEAFGAFWTNYPKKIDRGKAKDKWIAAMRKGVDPALIVDRAQAYARSVAGESNPRFIAYAANWLHNERYHDEYPEAPAGQPNLHVVGKQRHQPFQPRPNANYSKGFGS